MKKIQTNKLWGAAFTKEPSEAVIAFTAGRDVASVPVSDVALIPYDIWVNKAHVAMLGKTGIIPKKDACLILKGLLNLEECIKADKFILDPAKEDVHTNIEAWLTDKLGIDVAGKLHTARSRNDQIVTDMKLYMRDQILAFVWNSIELVQTLLYLAKLHQLSPFPGFTHHQHAMVTTFGHVLAGFATMILRDIERFEGWYPLHNQSPLGDAVAYGTSFPIDKKFTAQLLGFDGPDLNSIDAITNRWEAEADLACSATILMNHLSLMAETLILLSMPEFGMITIADEYTTGSSIMPQKKNPHPLEVMKGKTGYACGNFMGIMNLGKANFIGYNADSQWTKYQIMDIVNECLDAPIVMKGILETLTVHAHVMASWSNKGFIGATSLMEQLASQYDLPMRKAKVIVEKAVKASSGHDSVTYPAIQQALSEEEATITVSELQVAAWQNPAIIIGSTKSYGGPGNHAMKTSLKKLKKKLLSHKKWLIKKQKEKIEAQTLLTSHITSLTKEAV